MKLAFHVYEDDIKLDVFAFSTDKEPEGSLLYRRFIVVSKEPATKQQ